MKEKVQDLVRVLQDLTEKEQKWVLSCLTKCLTEDEQLRDLQQRVRGPWRTQGREGRRPVGRAADSLKITCCSGTGLISLDFWLQVSEVQRSGELRMEGPAGPLISSLFNTAGILVEARVEALWDVLDALEGEEGSGRRLGWRRCCGACVESNLGRKGVYVVSYIF